MDNDVISDVTDWVRRNLSFFKTIITRKVSENEQVFLFAMHFSKCLMMLKIIFIGVCLPYVKWFWFC